MAKDAYKYFRVEARELAEGLTQGVLQIEKASLVAEALPRLLRLAHTLKGAARVVRQAGIADLAHRMEGLLTVHREAGGPASPEQVAVLLGLIDEITVRINALDGEAPAAPASPAAAAAAPSRAVDEPFETVRVEMQEMDALLRDVTEAGVQLGSLRRDLAGLARLNDLAGALQDQLESRVGEIAAIPAGTLERARSIAEELRVGLTRFERGLSGNLERVEGELAEARGAASRLRLVPARTVFPALDRAVHDAAQTLGKNTTLETSGGDVRIDAGVLAALRDALLHVVRNAVAHGIETPAERVAAGKSPMGHVHLEVERKGARVVFRCRDDGRGVDTDAVREAAIARGTVSAARARALNRDEVLRLVFTAGISTQRSVSELAGRGIGLDVVRETVARLKGDTSITSDAGRGTAIEMQVPVSVASFTGLLVEAGGTVASLPFDAIRETFLVRDADIARTSTGASILHGGGMVPFHGLESLLRQRTVARRRSNWSAIVVESGGLSAAVGVDRVLGTASVVMRTLPDFVDADPVVAGVSLDAEGNPQIVLDATGLIAAIRAAGRVGTEEASPQRAPILVVDDSLTTRMLEKSILESAGYAVEIAVSAEEALEKAKERRYSLFIVDVEMPGMDGFTFVAQTRADPDLRATPAVLVTSRNAPEDRRRGEQSGARAYIVKSEFDQGRLLQIIRTLVG